MSDLPRLKIWRFERLITEHALDKLRLIVCSFAEFVVVVDDAREEEGIVTVYEPDDELWADGYRRRR